MILVFLGSLRATLAVFLSIPLSALAAFIALGLGGSTVNTMILGGLALAFSRLIDNSVVVLENIFRHLEMGEPPEVAAERGGEEVALPVLAATLTTGGGVFPGDLSLRREQVSVYGAGAVRGAVAVRFLLCGDDGGAAVLRELDQRRTKPTRRELRTRTPQSERRGWGAALQCLVQPQVPPDARPLRRRPQCRACAARWLTVLGITGFFVLSLALYPLIGKSYFPRTDPSQFVINVKAPSGTRLELTDQFIGASGATSCARWCRRRT